jgi:hypothetical protein
MTTAWRVDQEAYLVELSKVCETLSTRYKQMYDVYRRHQARFRIPSIVVSSALGLLSFGQQNFNDGHTISIIVGVGTVLIAIANSVETYMKIGENMSGCLLTSASLAKLKESIDLELSLSVDDRSNSGIIFVRTVASDYEAILNAAPAVLRRIRFVKPLSGVVIERSELGESPSADA